MGSTYRYHRLSHQALKILTFAGQIALTLNLSRSIGPIFAIICFIKPIVYVVFTHDLWDKGAFCSRLSNLHVSCRLIIPPNIDKIS